MKLVHLTLVGLGVVESCKASRAWSPSTSSTERTLTALQAVGVDGQLGVVCLGPGVFQGPALTLSELFDVLTEVGTVQAHLEAEMAGFTDAGKPLPPVAELQTTQYLFTGAFTNWSDEVFIEGAPKLMIMRGILDMVALHTTYLPGAAVGNADPGASCGPETDGARTADGTCNDQSDTLMGAAGTRFGRNVPLYATYGDEATLLEPNPRMISHDVLRRRGQPKEAGGLNMIGAAWTQFQNHDWFTHGDNDAVSTPISVPLPENDELRDLGLETLEIQRTMPDPTRRPEEARLPSTFLNMVTHWWDGSQLYGSDQASQDRLRSGHGGKLKMTSDGKLPVGASGLPDAGLTDNWWVGLELLQTVFANEHNAIADMLAGDHPDWDDTRLFNTARLINAALIARIHTVEWTPALLPHPTLAAAMNTNWNGLDQYTTPPYGATHPDPDTDAVINGIVGNPKQPLEHPYFLTEEFVSVYRMHPMLPEELSLLKASDGGDKAKVPVTESLDARSRRLIDDHGMADMLYSFGKQNSGSLELNNYPQFLQDIVLPHGIADLGTIDIVRDRERGIPRFNNARRLLALKPVSSFVELAGNTTEAEQLEKAYGDVEKVDLMVGMFAESTRPDCFGISETAFQVFTLMASRRLQTDRFYTTDYRPEVYTQEGIDWVEGTTMKDVLLRHYPELAAGLDGTTNAFMPWEPSHPDMAEPEPKCSNGVVGFEGTNENGSACCPLGCTKCGGADCGELGAAEGLGKDSCCITGVVRSQDLCSVTGTAPCKIEGKEVCGNGIPGFEGKNRDGSACCPLGCTKCGGADCDKIGAAEGLRRDSCCITGVLKSQDLCSVTGTAPCVLA